MQGTCISECHFFMLSWLTQYHTTHTNQYRNLLIVLPMREPSILRGIAVSLLRPVIGSNVEIDVVALNWVADVRKQIAKFAKQITNSTLSSFDSVFSNLLALEFFNFIVF